MKKQDSWMRSQEFAASMIMAAATLPMGYPVLLYALGRNIRFLQDLGFQSGPRGAPAAWVLALIVAVAYSVATIRSIPLVAQHWRAPTPLKGLALVLALVAGIVEEAVFRRMIMDSIMQAGGAVWLQVLASGFLFGIAHASWGLIKGNFAVARSAAIATTVLGGALAIIYVLGGRSLAPCITAHVLLTAVIEPGLMLAATSNTMRR